MSLLSQAKILAIRYKALTGKPLGITGEVAEFEAARLLPTLKLAEAREPGFDATEVRGDKMWKLQIKGRCLPEHVTPGQRLGAIDRNKEWDAVLMVLMNFNFETLEIWEASRAKVLEALGEPGSKSRNERGAMGVSKFKQIGKKRWPKLA
jgi:hypothetical protein